MYWLTQAHSSFTDDHKALLHQRTEHTGRQHPNECFHDSATACCIATSNDEKSIRAGMTVQYTKYIIRWCHLVTFSQFSCIGLDNKLFGLFELSFWQAIDKELSHVGDEQPHFCILYSICFISVVSFLKHFQKTFFFWQRECQLQIIVLIIHVLFFLFS